MACSGLKYVCISVCKRMVYTSDTADSIRQLCSATRISAFNFLLFLAWLREILVDRKKFLFFPTLPIDIVGIMVYS